MGKTIKVCLTNGGDDHETPWAHDLGPAAGPKGSRKVRLVNVPFLHAKPTWGDVIVVTPRRGVPTWDRSGAILEDGGRWAMILEYAPQDAEDGEDDEDPCFDALTRACADLEIVCECSFSPKGRPRGRAYLAVKQAMSARTVMRHLASAALACRITQLFPKPAASDNPRRRAPGGAVHPRETA